MQQGILNKVGCVAIIDREDQPVYFGQFMKDSMDSKFFQLQVYSVLDTVEQILRKKLGEQTSNEQIPYHQYQGNYLGVVMTVGLPENSYDAYAYITTTKIKIIILLQQKRNQEKTNIQKLCELMHRFYVAMQAQQQTYDKWEQQINTAITQFESNKL